MYRWVCVIALVVAGVLAEGDHHPQESAQFQAAVSKLSYSSPGQYQSFPLYQPPSSPYYYQTYGYQPQYYYYNPAAAAPSSNKKYVQLGYPYYPSYYYLPPPADQQSPEDPSASTSTTPKPVQDMFVDHSGASAKNPLYQPYKTVPFFPYYYVPAMKPSSEGSSSGKPVSQQFTYTNPFYTAQYDANKQNADYPYKFNYAQAYPVPHYQPASFGYQYSFAPPAATTEQTTEDATTEPAN